MEFNSPKAFVFIKPDFVHLFLSGDSFRQKLIDYGTCNLLHFIKSFVLYNIDVNASSLLWRFVLERVNPFKGDRHWLWVTAVTCTKVVLKNCFF